MSFNISSFTLSADATAEKIYSYDVRRGSVRLKLFSMPLTGSENVFIGTKNDVVINKGYPVSPSFTSPVVFENVNHDLYAIVATAANSNIVIFEEFTGPFNSEL